MGANMARRLLAAGHEVVGHDVNADNVAALVREGAIGAASLDELIARLKPPRAVWLMLASGALFRASHIPIEQRNTLF